MTTASTRLPVPDETLLRRFGLVRAVGGAGYLLVVVVLLAVYGLRAWPLLVGAAVLAVATTAYFRRSGDAPRASVVTTLVADALVIGGTVAFLGGTGSGALGLYAIVVLSAGVLLGPAAAVSFTGLCMALAVVQLGLEQLGLEPALLWRPDLGERLPTFLASLAALGSVGYLTASYVGRLTTLVAEARVDRVAVADAGRRRRTFVRQATVSVREPLGVIEEVAGVLDERWEELSTPERRRLAARLRVATVALDSEVGQLADAGVLDADDDARPEPLALREVVEDVVVGLGTRLEGYVVDLDLGETRVVGDRRAARRVVHNLLENVVEHTPVGTAVSVRDTTAASRGVLVVADDGPGIAASSLPTLFSPSPDVGLHGHVGLPLVAELCERMGADIRCEPPRQGTGTRFLVAFRLAPSGAAPAPDDGLPAVVAAAADPPAPPARS